MKRLIEEYSCDICGNHIDNANVYRISRNVLYNTLDIDVCSACKITVEKIEDKLGYDNISIELIKKSKAHKVKSKEVE